MSNLIESGVAEDMKTRQYSFFFSVFGPSNISWWTKERKKGPVYETDGPVTGGLVSGTNCHVRGTAHLAWPVPS